MNILITSASRKVSLVRAFQKALAAEGGGVAIAVDASPLSAALRLADRGYLVPRGLDEPFTSAVEALCRRHAVRLIVPTRDEELPYFAARLERFAELGATVMVSSPETIRVCQDKRLFLTFLQEHGFGTPTTYTPEEVRPDHYPLFVKERFGKGSRATWVVDTPDDLSYVLRKASEPIIQLQVEAPEYTIDLFADFAGRVLSVVPRQRLSIFAGESFLGRTCKNPQLMAEAVRLAEALQLRGHNTLQCFLDHGVVRWIEVNPRYGGAAHLSIAAGADSPRMLLRLLNGEALAPAIGAFKDGLVMLRYTEDLFHSASDMETVERVDQGCPI